MNPDASPPRPLPIRPRPVTGESPASYLRRLARANHLRPGYLRRYLRSPGEEAAIRLDWLAVLAGGPPSPPPRAPTTCARDPCGATSAARARKQLSGSTG